MEGSKESCGLWLCYANGSFSSYPVKKDILMIQKKPAPPLAPQKNHYVEHHGDRRSDPWFWLRERNNPEVLAYLEAENAYTEAMMGKTVALQKKLFLEMKGRMKETDLSVPVQRGPYLYYSRTEAGKQYRRYCRRPVENPDGEEILLDENLLAKGHDYFEMGNFSISPNHELLAYSSDTEGSERYQLFVKNLRTGELLPDTEGNLAGSLTWANDNCTLFYTTLDEAHRPDKLWRRPLGADDGHAELLYHEVDPAFFISCYRTRSNRYLLLSIGSRTTSEAYYLDADRPDGTFKLIAKRQPQIEYHVDHHGENFLIRSNEDAPNFKLMRTPVSATERSNWKELVPHRPDTMLEDIDAFKNHIVRLERHNGLRQLIVYDIRQEREHEIAFNEAVYTCWTALNPEYDHPWFRFYYTSLVIPTSVYDYHLDTREQTLLKQEEVIGGYDPTAYRSERIVAVADDGTKIPISLVCKKGLSRNGSTPLYLYGYGAYGVCLDPWFSPNRLSLLDRGFVFAIAHVRGGSEMGQAWHDSGKMENKQNTFNDFISCGKHLIAQNYCHPEKLVISGGSAGGLLIGAVINQQPELAGVAVATVPFVDVLNTMLDASLPLTVGEYEEWGNPLEEEAYFRIKSYSPYDNVHKVNYPHLLITAGLNDPRVSYWESAKWTAKLRVTRTGNRKLLLKTLMGAGHRGSSGRYDYLEEIAFEFAFILSCLKIEN